MISHEGHNIGLGYGLPFSNGQGAIRIGHVAIMLRDKEMPFHRQHGLQDSRIIDPPSFDVLRNHLLAGSLVEILITLLNRTGEKK